MQGVRDLAFQLASCLASGGCGSCIDKISNSFGLGQGHPAVANSAQRELAGICETSVQLQKQFNQGLEQNGRAMAVEFNKILASKRMRISKKANQGLVQDLACEWIN